VDEAALAAGYQRRLRFSTCPIKIQALNPRQKGLILGRSNAEADQNQRERGTLAPSE